MGGGGGGAESRVSVPLQSRRQRKTHPRERANCQSAHGRSGNRRPFDHTFKKAGCVRAPVSEHKEHACHGCTTLRANTPEQRSAFSFLHGARKPHAAWSPPERHFRFRTVRMQLGHGRYDRTQSEHATESRPRTMAKRTSAIPAKSAIAARAARGRAPVVKQRDCHRVTAPEHKAHTLAKRCISCRRI